MPQPIVSKDTFEHHLRDVSQLPEWLHRRKQNAWQTFQSLPMPRRKDENWRFSNVEHLSLDGFALPQQSNQEAEKTLAQRSALLAPHQSAGSLIFADNRMLEHHPLSTELHTQGVVWEPLESALEAHSDLISQHLFANSIDLGSRKFLALNEAYCTTGAFLYVPRGVQIPHPLIIYNWAHSSHAALFPQTLVLLEDNARAEVIDVYLSSDLDTSALVCSRTHHALGPGSHLCHQSLQLLSPESFCIHIETAETRRDARAELRGLHLGGLHVRIEQQVRLSEPGADAKLYSLAVADKTQEVDQRTLQIHSAPNATSKLLYKNALLDRARTIFSGMIVVEENAQQTDAYQTNRNLLLSDRAEANSLPGLEIQANDVKCSHGATTGKLDEEALFYLRSRGLSKTTAQELLVFGFFEEVIAGTPNEALVESLRTLIQDKLHGKPLLCSPEPPSSPSTSSHSDSIPRTLICDCPALLIPDGTPFTLKKGTEVRITHRLGGNFTVLCEFGMFRVNGQNAAALGEKVSIEQASASTNVALDRESGPPSEEVLWKQLRTVFDPEIPVNIVDLGLVYHLELKPRKEGGHRVEAAITLTAPGCGMGPAIAEDARQRLLALPSISEASVEIVWDPPWNQDMISEQGKMELGLI